jgi:hypothetical protein
MRRWIFIAALSTALLCIPLWAQRGGHGGMGGSHGGMGMSGGHGSAGAPYGGGSSGGAYHGGNWGGAYHGGYGHGAYGHPGHYPYYPGRYPYYRYPWGYGGYYPYGGYGYPWLSFGWYGGAGWSGAYYSYPEQTYPNYVYASPDNSNDGNDNAAYNQQQAQIDQLNNEVDRLRAEREADTARNYVPQPPKPEIRASTVLVFRDQHSEEIENYAIVGKTVWVFTEQRARKIPIAELNIPATTKANEARGIDFRLPTP